MPAEKSNGASRRSRLTAAHRLATRQSEVEWEERRDALRSLLASPMISAEGDSAADFRKVRRNSTWLKRWLARWPGWTLIVANDVARLRKHPSPRADATRGLEEQSRVERTLFTRRGYALLCLVLATLEHEHRQTTLQQVARKTEIAVRVDMELGIAGFEFDPKILAHRRELVNVMRRLEQWRVLARIDRDDSDFVQGDGDCLYRIDRAGMTSLLCSVHGASTVQTNDTQELIERMNQVEVPESPDARNRHLQHRLVRRLLDDPVMYFDELTAHEHEYFNTQAERLLRELTSVTGMVAERRAEGVALLDLDGAWTDIGLPELGTRGHATLLIAEWLADRLAENRQSAGWPGTECAHRPQGCAGNSALTVFPQPVAWRVSIAEVNEQMSLLAREHQKHWRKGCDTPEGSRRLANDAIALLRSLNLVELRGEHVEPRPAIARYRVASVPEVT